VGFDDDSQKWLMRLTIGIFVVVLVAVSLAAWFAM
jgi:hypothetical protein